MVILLVEDVNEVKPMVERIRNLPGVKNIRVTLAEIEYPEHLPYNVISETNNMCSTCSLKVKGYCKGCPFSE